MAMREYVGFFSSLLRMTATSASLSSCAVPRARLPNKIARSVGYSFATRAAKARVALSVLAVMFVEVMRWQKVRTLELNQFSRA